MDPDFEIIEDFEDMLVFPQMTTQDFDLMKEIIENAREDPEKFAQALHTAIYETFKDETDVGHITQKELDEEASKSKTH